MKKSNPLFDELIVIDDPTPRPGPLNMAIDEVLLSRARSAILRFYRWNEPAISFGYFVTFAEASVAAGDRAMVRRWTGGGIVPHGADLTYSIMIGSNSDTFSLPSKSIYENVHRALCSALMATNGDGPLLAVAALYERRNEADSAVIDRRYNGSIQRGNLSEEFRRIFSQLLANQFITSAIDLDILSMAEELGATKYAADAWLHRR
ncbi:MAG: hypothetical protein DME32_05275 [Verrucomicrobia bacterium]|nr:MAG: hypothetical protein DME32_05275 [Verrucomicrobiota bacterium]